MSRSVSPKEELCKAKERFLLFKKKPIVCFFGNTLAKCFLRAIIKRHRGGSSARQDLEFAFQVALRCPSWAELFPVCGLTSITRSLYDASKYFIR